ncbi:hypothetical protein V498_00217 [Pseudogymnoascus sp. VKM F-4517 (FW-2822)]|nr:hypothetical protein V498_00217 [Pseudogymnoascus sp. VKM F-4517 (FW-2822)]
MSRDSLPGSAWLLLCLAVTVAARWVCEMCGAGPGNGRSDEQIRASLPLGSACGESQSGAAVEGPDGHGRGVVLLRTNKIGYRQSLVADDGGVFSFFSFKGREVFVQGRSRSREEGDWSGAGKAGQSAGGYMLLSRQTPSRTSERHGVAGLVDGCAGGYMLLSRQTPSRTSERHGVAGLVDGLVDGGWYMGWGMTDGMASQAYRVDFKHSRKERKKEQMGTSIYTRADCTVVCAVVCSCGMEDGPQRRNDEYEAQCE